MKQSEIERAALNVYAFVFLNEWKEHGDVEHVRATAMAALCRTLDELGPLAKSLNRRAAAKRLKPEKGTHGDADALLTLYRETFPRFTMPAMPIDSKGMLWKRLMECGAEGLDVWRKRFDLVRKSDFLMGKAGHFQATLPWLLQKGNIAKIEAGSYP